ncbi:hypothetical protein DYB36_009887 [Aphanomyces astaci]|uniref:Cyclic nucleotide-binding domain-containing protein n=1 Tax=Aphanomyces astaci TaxID=112090 RepID=A0A397BC58_APHAT|nr:hypothetical protein DYB36_009887 [Aphanomyces astaci]
MSILNQPGISQPTRTTIALHLYRDLIESVPYFAGEDSKFLGRVCLALKTAVYLPDAAFTRLLLSGTIAPSPRRVDTIIQEGDTGREMFFVRRGLVNVEVPTGPPHIQLKDGDFFGEMALVVDVRRTNTVRAVTICDLNVLSKNHITSPKDKAIIEAELNDVVNETAKRRKNDTTSPYWHVLNAKRVGNKLKDISDKVRLAQERKPRLSTVMYRPRGRLSRPSAVSKGSTTSKRSIANPASIGRLLETIDVPMDDQRRQIVDNNGIPDKSPKTHDEELLPPTDNSVSRRKTVPKDPTSKESIANPASTSRLLETIDVPTDDQHRQMVDAVVHLTNGFRDKSTKTHDEDVLPPTDNAMGSSTPDTECGPPDTLIEPPNELCMLESLSNRLAVMEKSVSMLPQFVKAFEDAMKHVAVDVTRFINRKHLPPLQCTKSEQVVMDTSYGGALVMRQQRDRSSKNNSSMSLPSMLEAPMGVDVEDTPSHETHHATPSDIAPPHASNRVLPVGSIVPVVHNPLTSDRNLNAYNLWKPGIGSSGSLLRRFISFVCAYHIYIYIYRTTVRRNLRRVVLQTYHGNIDIYHEAPKTFQWMIHPNSNFRKVWDTIIAVMVLYVCYLTPLYLAFDFLDWEPLYPLLRFGILLKYLRQYAKYYNLLLTTSAMVLCLHCFAYDS